MAEETESLLPGLPEDVSREVLCRLPYASFSSARSVSPLWKQELSSPAFHRLRRTSGQIHTLIVVSQASPEPNSTHPRPAPYRLAIFDTLSRLWSSLPPSPHLPHGLPLFCGLAAAGTTLAVIGGWDPSTWTTSNAVHVYDLASSTWRRGKSMPGPLRSSFACFSAENGLVYVAGGHDESQNELRSAFRYDVEGEEWARVGDVACGREEWVGAYVGGEVVWGEEGWRVAGDGERVYGCFERSVAVSEGSGRWRRVAEVPEMVKVVVQVVAWEGRVVVMGVGREKGCGLVVYELENAGMAAMETTEKVVWRRVEVPPEFQGRVQAACCIDI